jgi:hypothetical protein
MESQGRYVLAQRCVFAGRCLLQPARLLLVQHCTAGLGCSARFRWCLAVDTDRPPRGLPCPPP